MKSNPASNVRDTGAVTATRGSKLTFHAIAVDMASTTSNELLESAAAAAMSASTADRPASITFAAAATSGDVCGAPKVSHITKGVPAFKLNRRTVGSRGSWPSAARENVTDSVPSSPQSIVRSEPATEMLAAALQNADGWITIARSPASSAVEFVDTTTTLSSGAPARSLADFVVADSTVKLTPVPGGTTLTDVKEPS